MTNIDQKSVNAIRILAADQIQKANSGHPGAPLGTAPMMYELWANHLNHNPKDPKWVNRDRFVLSGGHGSAGLYALLHLFGYGLTVDDLKNFRQFGSLTPGHPEYGHTVGVECSTGPLGSGLAASVGMAIAEKHKAALFNREGYPVVDHCIFTEVGDGDMMEGIAQESLSLAGTMGLDRLIVLYDANNITIEGDTDLAFREDVAKRMEALGFSVWVVEDGTDMEAVGEAIEAAKADRAKPSFILVKNRIGYGSSKEGSASSHGEPLGEEVVKGLRNNLGWEHEEDFYVSDDVYQNFRELAKKGAEAEEEWKAMYEAYKKAYPELADELEKYHSGKADLKILEDESFWEVPEKPEATRASSGRIINMLKDAIPHLIGGSADLGPSNKTLMKGEKDFSAETPEGRNLHYGVRELAMGGISNGLALSGMRPYAGTFFVFSDYIKPMVRMASLMNLPVTYVFTHDSIGVGEDGPTHQPVEHLAMFRSLPNLIVFRPADAMETAAGWAVALQSETTPVALILTRQNVEQVRGTSKDAMRGAYVLSESMKAVPDAILIATGSEVALAMKAKKILEDEKGYGIRVVSMPSMELFEKQSDEYKESVLPKAVRNRVAIEASQDYGWGRYVGLDGRVVGMADFGASAPGSVLFDAYGFTPENVVKETVEMIESNR